MKNGAQALPHNAWVTVRQWAIEVPQVKNGAQALPHNDGVTVRQWAIEVPQVQNGAQALWHFAKMRNEELFICTAAGINGIRLLRAALRRALWNGSPHAARCHGLGKKKCGKRVNKYWDDLRCATIIMAIMTLT